MQLSNLFSLSYWLDPSVAEQRAGPAMWLVVAAGLAWFGIGLVLARRSTRVPRSVASAQMIAGLLAAAVAIGRLFAIPVLGLRAGWLVAGAIAASPILVIVARQAWHDGLPGDCARAMAFESAPRENGSWRLSTKLAWLALHLVGLSAVMVVLRLPLWLGPILIAVILSPHITSLFARRISNLQSPISTLHAPRSTLHTPRSTLHAPRSTLQLPALAPLLWVYAVLAARVAVGMIARVTTGEYRVVEPFGALLNLPLTLVVMSAYALAISVSFVARPSSFVRSGAAALIAGTVVWAMWTASVLHTRGVTGSDPYAYAQMGVDLAERGTVFHAFPLVEITHDLGIPSDPIVHVGYRLPQDARREATTVWPPGYAVFTGLAYKLSGEAGLYLVTPLLSLLSLAAAGWLAYQVVRSAYGVSDTRYAPRSTLHAPRSTPSIAAVVALTVFLTATSYQQVEWQLIPMADVAAQLFSVLALGLVLRQQTTDNSGQTSVVSRLLSLVSPALCGLCLGIAFSIRYTQVLIAPALALALWLHPSPSQGEGQGVRVRVTRIAVCALFALLAAAPVLIYHTAAFGSPLHTGSEEGSNFSLTRLPETLGRILSELNSHREYGLLTLFIAIGVYALWRAERRVLWVLAAYVLPLFVFHVAYWPLRLRDILSLFPVLNLLAALGAVWVVERAVWSVERARFASRSTLYALRIALIVVLSFAIILRSMDTLALPITRGFGAFGYLVREQRESFARLAELTPPDAVVGSSLNSGAVDLHAGRQAFRPAGWTPDELTRFVRALQAEGRPVFLLEDGDEVLPAVDTLRRAFGLSEIARLDMPYYFPGSGSENRKARLYRVLSAQH